jgi:hypothetical protein
VTDWKPGPVIREAALHQMECHSDWEYKARYGPRENWEERDTPPDGSGWELNAHVGDNGYTLAVFGDGSKVELSHWRRPLKR